MKKTISINIGGIIFHIDEDGYNKLKSYLDSITKYFSTFDDSGEIISDIEGRIAEIFLAKLQDGKQTLNLEDVDDLIATMGTTKDFEASIGEDPDDSKKEAESEPVGAEAPGTQEAAPSKKLYRDTKRKILGGVSAGIAHYFAIDPLWIRLLFLALFFNIFFSALSGAVFLGYIILWIVLPPNDKLEEDKKVKKLFRNSEERVIGGVASGIASYFGTDTTVIRLLFVLTIFLGGSGILAYIILWIITPEAKTITEKMQMQGEPVTLSNIEGNIKKSLHVKEGEESALVKILLFPFRLIAIVLNGIVKILGPFMKLIVDVLRIGFGAIMSIIGFAIMVALIIAAFAIAGIGQIENMVHIAEIPTMMIRDSIGILPMISVFVVVFIPALALTLLGLVIILKRRVANAYVGWSIFALWVAGLVMASFTIPTLVKDFSSENDYRIEQNFTPMAETPVLRLNDLGDDGFDLVELRLRGHEDSVFQAITTLSARGSSRTDAEENAKAIEYVIKQEGKDFYFDSKITFPENSKFRFQEADIVFYIPYGQTFRMDRNLEEILINTLYINGYRVHQMEGNDWAFDMDGLKCLTCPEETRSYDRDSKGVFGKQSKDYDQREQITFPFENFNAINLSAFVDYEIIQGDTYTVRIQGDKDNLDDTRVNQIGDKLELSYRQDDWKFWEDREDDKIKVFITLPSLENLTITGACSGDVVGFDDGDMEIELTGVSEINFSGNPSSLEVQLNGASKGYFRGKSRRAEFQLLGASEIKAFDFLAESVEVEALGASNGEIYASQDLDLRAAGLSKIRYRGTDRVQIDVEGISSVKRD